MEWQQWPSVAFGDRHLLPACSGIYVIADDNQFVWYVGQAVNLQSRWVGRSHHRYPQLIRTNRKLKHRIYWRAFLAHLLNEQERFCIDQLKPELNGCKVKTYLPNQPQVEREIKRLFKAINRPTLLFPVIRSAIAGEYVNNDGTHCIVTISNLNDFHLPEKSARKRYSAEVKRAWIAFDSYCGRSSDLYHAHSVNAYSFNRQRFEFVAGADILEHLEQNPSTYERVVGTSKLFGVAVTALRDLSILDELSLAEEYAFLRDDKKTLNDIAYLNYRRQQLTSLLKEL